MTESAVEGYRRALAEAQEQLRLLESGQLAGTVGFGEKIGKEQMIAGATKQIAIIEAIIRAW